MFFFHDCVVTESGGQMRLAYPRWADDYQICRSLQPLSIHELHESVTWKLGIERPVEVVKHLHPFYPRHSHQLLDPLVLSQLILLAQELLQELSVLVQQALWIAEEPEVAPQVR